MDHCRVRFDEHRQCLTYDSKPVKVTESETSYIFKDVNNDEIVYFLDYSHLLQVCNNDNYNNELTMLILRVALLSDGYQIVPTILLLPDRDRFVHNKVPHSLTSLKKLAAWLEIISLNVYDLYNIDACTFQPFEKLQISDILKSIGLNDSGDGEAEGGGDFKKCLNDSREIFDFKHNLIKITWFPLGLKKYGSKLPIIRDKRTVYELIHPCDAFLEANKLMRQICVWESSNYDMERVIASNIVFIYFLQDTNSSTNAYTPLLPIMQALYVYNTSPTRPVTVGTIEAPRTKSMYDVARFNRERDHGLYRFHLKMKGIQERCNRGDCFNLIAYNSFDFNIFKDREQDQVFAYLRHSLNALNKSEMYIYVLFFGICLVALRFAKPVKNITGMYNLATFEPSNVVSKDLKERRRNDKSYEEHKRQWRNKLSENIRQDMGAIFDFIDIYVDFMQAADITDMKINDEILFYFMQTNDGISRFVNYLIQTILPLVTAQLA